MGEEEGLELLICHVRKAGVTNQGQEASPSPGHREPTPPAPLSQPAHASGPAWSQTAPTSPQAGLGSARPTDGLPQTQSTPSCGPSAPAWQSLNGGGVRAQGLLHLYPHLRQEATQRVWGGSRPGGQDRAPTGILTSPA